MKVRADATDMPNLSMYSHTGPLASADISHLLHSITHMSANPCSCTGIETPSPLSVNQRSPSKRLLKRRQSTPSSLLETPEDLLQHQDQLQAEDSDDDDEMDFSELEDDDEEAEAEADEEADGGEEDEDEEDYGAGRSKQKGSRLGSWTPEEKQRLLQLANANKPCGAADWEVPVVPCTSPLLYLI